MEILRSTTMLILRTMTTSLLQERLKTMMGVMFSERIGVIHLTGNLDDNVIHLTFNLDGNMIHLIGNLDDNMIHLAGNLDGNMILLTGNIDGYMTT